MRLGFHQPVERLERGRQFAKTGDFCGWKPARLPRGQFIEQPPAQVFLEMLPGAGAVAEPGLDRSQ